MSHNYDIELIAQMWRWNPYGTFMYGMISKGVQTTMFHATMDRWSRYMREFYT